MRLATSRFVPLCIVLLLGATVSPVAADDAAPVSVDGAALDAARRNADVTAAAVAGSRARLATIEDEVRAVAEWSAAIEARLAHLRRSVQDQAVERFVRGGAGAAGPADLLRSDGIDEAVRADVLARTVTESTDEVVSQYRAAGEELAGSRRRLTELRGQAAAAVRELDAQAAAAVAELERQVVVDAQHQQVADGVGGTGFLCPVDGPRAFTNDWGMARSGGRRHQGTDMLSPRGTPVVASVGGTVVGHSSSLGGTSFTLTGDDGNTYYGTHLASLSGASGRVERGAVLGYVGNSGNARGGPTHLHFEVRPGGGGAVNPFPTLAEHC